MADYTITAANVIPASDATIERGTAGASIAAGKVVYQDSSDSNKIKLADANNSAATATVVGIALNAAESGQPVDYIRDGDVAMGSIFTIGDIVVLSATAGGAAPSADIATGWRVSILGVATSATNLRVKLNNSGALKP